MYRNTNWQRPAGRRWRLPVTLGVAAAVAAGGLGVAMAATDDRGGQSITCPDVAGKLPAVPARAKAEVDRNLALLQTQINEADNRLATSAGQGGKNFVQNAILGPLKDKRVATINRIATAIGRIDARPGGLDALAPCSLGAAAARPPAGAEPPAAKPPAPPAPPAAEPPAAAAGRIVCPDISGKLPAVPAQAKAEVDRNLALLQTQINEADNRLATSAGQGGKNFVQNAILGPLEDKRVATINRIATAIGRIDARPGGLDALAPCSLSD